MPYQSQRRRGGSNVRERAKVLRSCDVQGCSRPRVWTTSRCYQHNLKNTRHGKPTARAIKKSEWAPYRKLARALFKKNEGHEALVAADEFMAQLLTPGPERSPKRNGPGAAEYHLQIELARLKKAAVTPRQALEAAVAVWLLALEQPATLPDDIRLTKALGNAVLRIAKLRKREIWVNGKQSLRTRPPAGGALDLLGRKIRDHLGVLVLHLEKLIAADRQTLNEELSKSKEPPKKPRPFRVLIRRKQSTETEIPEVPLDAIH
jgi:hypothetical protein